MDGPPQVISVSLVNSMVGDSTGISSASGRNEGRRTFWPINLCVFNSILSYVVCFKYTGRLVIPCVKGCELDTEQKEPEANDISCPVKIF